MSLALATLIYEWRRYLAAIIALAFSGMMVLAFSGMFAGIIHAEFATWERSRADLIILPANVKSLVNSNASLPARVKPLIYLQSRGGRRRGARRRRRAVVNIAEARPEAGADASCRSSAVEPYRELGDPADRLHRGRSAIALMEPGAVAIDASDLVPLGVKLGDKAVAQRPHGLGARGAAQLPEPRAAAWSSPRARPCG